MKMARQKPALSTWTSEEMTHSQADLRSFLEQAADQVVHIRKPVDPANQVAALCSETTQPILFENVAGYPDFRITDCLTRFRDTQAMALGIEGGPGSVIPGYVARLSQGPGPTIEITDSPVAKTLYRVPRVSVSSTTLKALPIDRMPLCGSLRSGSG